MSRHKEAGQSVVELAILLPLLMLILLGCIDLGHAFSVWLAVVNVSREGARYACVYPSKVDIIEKQIEDEILAEGLHLEDLGKDVSMPEGTDPGDPVRVSVAYTLPVLTSYLFGGQPLVIRTSTEMPITVGG